MIYAIFPQIYPTQTVYVFQKDQVQLTLTVSINNSLSLSSLPL